MLSVAVRLCSRMVVPFDFLECIGIVIRSVWDAVVGCGHLLQEERKRQPGAYADRLSRAHGTLFSLTTT